MRKKTTVMDENDYSDYHRNQEAVRLTANHGNHYTKKREGQSIIEYAMFIAVVVLALLAMQIYFKRGLQGKIRDMADQISPVLYNPNTTVSDFTTSASSRTNSSYIQGEFSQDVVYESSNRSGSYVVYPETVERL